MILPWRSLPSDAPPDPVPYCIQAAGRGLANLVRLNDGRMHLSRDGAFGPLICGFQHILCGDALGDLLRESCGASAIFARVAVVNFVNDEVLTHYWDVQPHEQVTPATISTVDVRGARLWHFDHCHLFASPSVVQLLAAHRVAEVLVSPGFNGFV
jgi:hypothetical protein